MARPPSSDEKNKTTESPAPEVLQPQRDDEKPAPEAAVASGVVKTGKKPHRGTYRPSHKATFIGLAVVVAVLALNAGIVAYLLQPQSETGSEVQREEVTIGPAALEKLGVSRNAVGDLGTELVVGPDSRFNGKVTIAGNVSIAGQLELNSTFSATQANLANLQAGDTSLGQLNVNGDGTMTNLNIRENLAVAGTTQLQGTVTMSQLLTVNNNVNVAGDLSVGGTLSARSFQAGSLVSGSTLTIGGHIITRGAAPGVSRGPGVGSNGTVSISGNDAAGTVAVNAGTGAGGGIVAEVTFRSSYGNTPRVVVTAVGRGADGVYINRSARGFSIGINGSLSAGGHAFDYIVMQ